jgi:DNA polymerase-3 subunit gamma/tau
VVERAAPGSIDAAAVRRVWDEVLTTVRRRSQKAWAVVREAVVRDVQGDELILVFQHGVHANMFGAQAQLLLEAVREVFGGTWRVRAEVGGDARPAPPPTAAASATSPPATTPPPTNSPTTSPGRTADDGDWPTPARPGGNAAAPAEAPQPSREPAAARSKAAAKRPEPARAPANRSTPNQARAAAATANPARRPGRDDGPPPDEPPFDPDYDRPTTYEGFDPGDEPLDDAVDPSQARTSGEEQAIALLTEKLGAERIGESG